jgi:hypothetical protein
MEKLIEFEDYGAYNEFIFQRAGGAEMKKLGLLFIVVISLVFTVSCVDKEVPVTETYSETEYKTEYKMETYTTTEDVVVKTTEGKTYIEPILKWQTGLYLSRVGSGIGMSHYYGYEISTAEHPRVKIEVSVSQSALKQRGGIAVCDLTGLGQIPHVPESTDVGNYKSGVYVPPPIVQEWLDQVNSVLTNSARTLGYLDTNTGSDRIVFDANGIKEFCIIANTWIERPISGVQLVWADDVIEPRTVSKEREVPYQVPYQVEKQRTVMETKQVPFWEAWRTNPPAETETSSLPTIEAKPVVTETSPDITTETSPVTIIDDFSNSNSGCGTSSDDWGKFAYEGGEYSILIEKMNWFGYHLNSVSGKQEDFTVEVDARKLSQGTDDAAGIIFRDQRGQGKDSFYVFWVDSNSGTYAIQKYIKDVWAPDLKDFTPSSYINRGANTNRLKVTCKGSQIEVYANDYKLTTVTDISLSNGFIGLAAKTLTSPNAHYHFDNFKLYTND